MLRGETEIMRVGVIILLGLFLLPAGCSSPDHESSSSQKSAYEGAKQSLEARGIHFGPIRHAKLSPNLVDRIRHLEEAFSEVYPISHDEWLDGFQRDRSPENEIERWEQMASAYTAFLKANKIDAPGRREAFGLLLIRSRSSNVESRYSSLRHLTISQAKSLVALYSAPPKPVMFQDSK